MTKYYYQKTVTFFLSVDADSQEDADDIADNTDINSDEVVAEYSREWEYDGEEDE